jgi:hypothetical protein
MNVKAGVLLLDQFDTFRGGSDSTIRCTAKFDEKNWQVSDHFE